MQTSYAKSISEIGASMNTRRHEVAATEKKGSYEEITKGTNYKWKEWSGYTDASQYLDGRK
jgi:hypothetical protein